MRRPAPFSASCLPTPSTAVPCNPGSSPMGALGSLSQLASGGIAAAVRALLQDRKGPKLSRKLPVAMFPGVKSLNNGGKTTASSQM